MLYYWNSDNRLIAATITTATASISSPTSMMPMAFAWARPWSKAAAPTRLAICWNLNVPDARVLGEWSSLNGQPASQSAGYTYGASLISQNRSGTMSFYHQDALGSTRLLTSQACLATDTYDYDAFG